MDAFLIGGSKSQSSRPKQQSVKDKKRLQSASTVSAPWVEKYRPRRVDDISSQEEVVNLLKKSLQESDVLNLLFHGPPGTGKTSAALALCRQLFGPELYKQRVLEMNASDERGIQVVRSKIKDFARLAVGSTRPDGKACPPLKIVVLDEADSMTMPAQAALRRTMEKQTKTTRFFIICNYISRIIDPLTSRCAKFRFKPLPMDTQMIRLKEISSLENVNVTEEGLRALIDWSEGDMRKSVTYLQSVSISHRHHDTNHQIDKTDIDNLVGVVPPQSLHSFLRACQSANYDNVMKSVQALQRDAYPAYQVLLQLFDIIVSDKQFNDSHKAAICDGIGLCEYRLLDGADEFLQMMHIGCIIMEQYKTVTPS